MVRPVPRPSTRCGSTRKSLTMMSPTNSAPASALGPPMTSTPAAHPHRPRAPTEWVDGSLDFSGANRSNWDIDQDIKKSLLWSYCGNSPDIWKCPADTSTVKYQGVTRPRVRSISMNAWFNSTDVEGFGSG